MWQIKRIFLNEKAMLNGSLPLSEGWELFCVETVKTGFWVWIRLNCKDE